MIEEVGEYWYHVDRMITHLARAGKFKGLKGIVVGSFSTMKDNKPAFPLSFYEIIKQYTHDLPIIFGLPVGHSQPNEPIILGAPVRVEATKKLTTIEFLEKIKIF
jgi:muramoyltetrapeptide carboxypeptidase